MVKLWLMVLLLGTVLCAESCTSDSDCEDLNFCESEECVHKELFPLDIREILGSIAVLIFAATANSAGVGGGPIMVPIMLLVLLFDTDSAIPLSQTVIFGGSMMAFFLKVSLRHPKKDRPLIYYSLLMHIQSTLLLGTTFGVILNTIFPSWLILMLLTIVLIYITYTTFKK